jgi:hypothetical protein
MNEVRSGSRWNLPRTAWIAFGVILLSVLVALLRSFIQPTLERELYHLSGLLLLAGLFGPGLLRESGLLRDRDEFQAAAARRAGFRAFLTGGITLLMLAHFMPWPDPPVMGRELPKLPLQTTLLVMLLTYVCSYLLDYWGTRRGATVILGTMAALSAFGAILDEMPDLMHVLIDLRFSAGFLLALLIARRYLQVAGLFLFAMLLLILVNAHALANTSHLPILALLTTPPLICGVAMIREEES